MESRSMSRLSTIMIYAIFLIFFVNFNIITVSAEENINIYTCDGTNAFAYEGETSFIGTFNNDNYEFSQDDYYKIGTDNIYYVRDNYYGYEFKFSYHRFEFPIIEDAEKISKISIKWHGGCNDGLFWNTTSFWLKENNNWKWKLSQEESQDYGWIYFNITNNFDNYLNNGILSIGLNSNSTNFQETGMDPPKDVRFSSNIKSYYIEVKVYSSDTLPTPQLQISSPGSVNEKTDFQVSVSSNNEQISGAIVNFSGESYITNENGLVTIQSPEVTKDTNFLITVFKQGFSSNQKYISVIDTDSEIIPTLEINTVSQIDENDVFQVEIYSEDQPVENAIITFSEDSYFTSSNGIVEVISPSVNQDTQVLLTAEKTGYQSDSKQILVIDNEASILEKLETTNPSFIYEGEVFQVQVKALNEAVENAEIIFEGLTYYTNEQGIVAINSPYVEENQTIIFTARKDGYLNDISSINIIDYIKDDISESVGFVYGLVTDEDENLLKDCFVCASSYIDDNVVSICNITDLYGLYVITLNPGTYYLSAKKSGYNNDFLEEITIKKDTWTQLNIQLASDESYTGSLIDFVLEEEYIKGKIFGSVDLKSGESRIDTYNDVKIDLESRDINSDDGINLKISGEGIKDSKLVVYLGEISSPEDISVIYDGEEIFKTNDYKTFFEDDNLELNWILTKGDNENLNDHVLIINIPHFSEHDISIKLLGKQIIPEDLGFSLIIYIIISIIFTISFIGSGLIRRRF